MSTAQIHTPSVATSAAPAAAQSGRGANGRFTVGNPGGPGNPFARRTAAMRQAISNAATAEDMDAISKKMIALAKDGNTAAAKLCYQYIAGKPTEPPNPDRLDADEWQRFKETAGMMVEMPALLDKPDPVAPLTLVRQTRPDVTRAICGRMGVVLGDPDAFHAAEEKAREAHFRQLEQDSLRAAAKYDGFVPDETGLPPEVKPIQSKANGQNGGKRAERKDTPKANGRNGSSRRGRPQPAAPRSAGSETRAEHRVTRAEHREPEKTGGAGGSPSANRFIEGLPDWCPPIPVSDEPFVPEETGRPPEGKASGPKANGKNGNRRRRPAQSTRSAREARPPQAPPSPNGENGEVGVPPSGGSSTAPPGKASHAPSAIEKNGEVRPDRGRGSTFQGSEPSADGEIGD